MRGYNKQKQSSPFMGIVLAILISGILAILINLIEAIIK